MTAITNLPALKSEIVSVGAELLFKANPPVLDRQVSMFKECTETGDEFRYRAAKAKCFNASHSAQREVRVIFGDGIPCL